MSFDFPTAERRLKNTARLAQQSMWLLLVIALSLMLIVRRSSGVRTGSLWILGCAIMAFMLTFALRDVIRKVGRRNTEDKIVEDVKTFLMSEPAVKAAPPVPPAPAAEAANRSVGHDVYEIAPRRTAGFVTLKDSAPLRQPGEDLVVFDAMPACPPATMRMAFCPVLLPIASN